MATAVVHTLRASGNGGDYTLMSTWEATEQRDLVALDETETLECYNDWADERGLVDTGITISGWTTDATRFPTIESAPGNGPDGVPGAGFRFTSNSASTLHVLQNYVVLRNIQVGNNTNSSSTRIINFGATGLLGDRCVIDHYEVPTPGFRGYQGQFEYRNCLSVNFSGTKASSAPFAVTGGPSADSYFNNCTAISSKVAAGSQGTQVTGDYSPLNFVNCICYGFTTDFTGGGSTGRVNCASKDGSWSTLVITDVDFEDYAADNYAPAESGLLDGAGADLSADFDYDIEDAARTVPWTIGAWIVAGAPPIGIQEMYVNIGGTFTKATPSVLVGGVWQPADAYVLVAGNWELVYEK